MSAAASDPLLLSLAWLIALGLAGLPSSARAASADAAVESRGGKATAAPSGAPASPAGPAAGRLLVFVEAVQLDIHQGPASHTPVVGRVEQGSELEADLQMGDWYRVRRSGGGLAGEAWGWVEDAALGAGRTVSVRPWPAGQALETPTGRPAPAGGEGPGGAPLDRARPQGAPIEPSIALIDPSRVAAPTAVQRGQTLPVRDRWRLMKSLGLLRYDPLDPYNPNVLKGDLPVLEDRLGKDWFFNLSVVSDTLVEARRLPTPSGAQSSLDPGTYGTLGRGGQGTVAQTAIVSLSLIKGNTTFRPPDYEFRVVPVFNLNRTVTSELRAVNVDPGRGSDRNDQFVGIQELFADKHLRDVSPRYDFDSLRVGIQPITADFRGFLFLDQAFGARLFGTRDNNQWQYNAGWFRRLEKDTNSGLNDLGRQMRADDVFLFNVYRQDLPVLGFTSQLTLLHNRNREGRRGDEYNANGFLERPAVLGTGRARNYDVSYLGYSADGHIDRLNLSGSVYHASGHGDRGVFSGRRERIGAWFGAVELSRDFDWLRVRLSGLYASGDADPYDGRAQGFDAVLENPQFAGADTSYWIRQSVPLIGGGGVALSMRNGLLPSLRSSREFGQSNFVNPGLRLVGLGADADLLPGLRLIGNLNHLSFDELATLSALRNQRLRSRSIGIDLSVGAQYRPYFTQNVVFNVSAAMLLPGRGLRELYGNALDAPQHSLLANLLLTF